MSTRNQKYAISAYKQVEQVSQDFPKQKSKYKSMCEKLPILIRTAGLTQALAFVEAKAVDEPAWKNLLKHLTKTLERPTLVADSRNVELGEYMRLTRDVLSVLLWYKRFAQSLLADKPSD